MRKAKVVEREKGPATADRRRPETNPTPEKAKATKADPKGKENPTNLNLAIANPIPAVTVGNLATRIGNAANDFQMRENRANLPTPITPNTLLPSKSTRQHLCLHNMLSLLTPTTPTKTNTKRTITRQNGNTT